MKSLFILWKGLTIFIILIKTKVFLIIAFLYHWCEHECLFCWKMSMNTYIYIYNYYNYYTVELQQLYCTGTVALCRICMLLWECDGKPQDGLSRGRTALSLEVQRAAGLKQRVTNTAGHWSQMWASSCPGKSAVVRLCPDDPSELCCLSMKRHRDRKCTWHL